MKLRHELSYDALAADVRTMLLDPAYWDAVAVATEAISSTATVEAVGSDTRVVVDQDQEVTGVPAFAKKFVGSSTRAIRTQVWHGNTASFEVDAPGKPSRIHGSSTVSENGARSLLTYDLELEASVPLIGGRLEKLMAGLITAAFEKEQQVGDSWLAGRR